eukprot:SAG25_NODE_1474_length_2946_cov_3.155899_2_plen_96_part_00
MGLSQQAIMWHTSKGGRRGGLAHGTRRAEYRVEITSPFLVGQKGVGRFEGYKMCCNDQSLGVHWERGHIQRNVSGSTDAPCVPLWLPSPHSTRNS